MSKQLSLALASSDQRSTPSARGNTELSNVASCTTNALAPVVEVVFENFGIKSGVFSAVHAYANTQSLTDHPMKDRRDSWAAAENIIPS
jgi:glyceraldehyde 3-phosphate dehydrogenase